MLDDMELYKSYTGLFNLHYFGGLRGEFDENKALGLAKKTRLNSRNVIKKSRHLFTWNEEKVNSTHIGYE
jgi:ABC-2 type transport system ATP-binding protein